MSLILTTVCYVLYGIIKVSSTQIDASSLISASVMAAPCALAISKLSYPETEKSKFTSTSQIKVDSGWVHLSNMQFMFLNIVCFVFKCFLSNVMLFVLSGEQNVLEAVSSGASASIGLVANIAANLIAFLAILDFINATLRWLGGMVGYSDVSFEVCITQT